MDYKVSKAEAKKHDAFVSTMETAWAEIEKHRKIWASIFGILVLLGAALAFYDYYAGRVESKAQADYYLAHKTFVDAKKQFKPEAEEPRAKKPEETVKAKAKTGDLNQDYGTAVTQLESVISKHGGSKAAVLAAIDLASVLNEYKQPDKAITHLQSAAKSLSKKDMLYGFVQFQLGDAFQVKGQCKDAIQSWETISQTKELGFLHPDALLRQALCYESLAQKDKAQELLKKLSQDFADTDAGKAAKKYLRQTSISAA